MKTKVHSDNRGDHYKFFEKSDVRSLGFQDVEEVFMTNNNKGTIRGLHRQFSEGKTQQKVIKALSGRFNVRVVFPLAEINKNISILDLIKDATGTFIDKEFIIAYFDGYDVDLNPILIPAGAYLGYLSLEDDSKMLYIGDNKFNAEADDGRNPFSLDIDWGSDTARYISERDQLAEPLEYL